MGCAPPFSHSTAIYDLFEVCHDQGTGAQEGDDDFISRHTSHNPSATTSSSHLVLLCPCHNFICCVQIVGISPNVNESDSTQSVASRLKQTKPIGRPLPPTNPALEWVTLPTNKTLPFALSASTFFLLQFSVRTRDFFLADRRSRHIAQMGMIEQSSTMEEESPHQLVPHHSILPNNSVADGKLSFEDKSRLYHSLVALVKAEYPFDKALQDRAALFLKRLEPNWAPQALATQLITDLVPSSAGSLSGFIDSIVTLLSSPHSTVVASTMSFLSETAFTASHAIRDRLVVSDLVSKVLAIIQPHTLSISGNEPIFDNLVEMISRDINLASPSSLRELGFTTAVGEYNHREMIFRKVVLPSSKFVTFLISNRHILNDDLLRSFVYLMATFLRIGPFHRPTLEFVLASPIVMAISSCLPFYENEIRLWITLQHINQSLSEWKRYKTEAAQSGQRAIKALFSEGFEDTLEQISMRDKDGIFIPLDTETDPQTTLRNRRIHTTQDDSVGPHNVFSVSNIVRDGATRCATDDSELHHANTPPNELASQHCRHSLQIAVHSTPNDRMDSSSAICLLSLPDNSSAFDYSRQTVSDSEHRQE
ncbi:hypothetical protein BLNAU_4873 [Blattamonas nauphoetae]|uniref:Uncharacterized protein n=1 Tax=Blattamonas nauphoetae TaxID=2049346 RepID=A0ABQ9Y8F7_9EUKA|nr:hypothetical protein BLNAU_4873 [Blattamonas nauphoetae]